MHPQAKKVSVIATFVIILLVLIGITYLMIKGWPKFDGIFLGPTGPTPTNPTQNISLEGYSQDLADPVNVWVVFEYMSEHFLVNQNSQGSGGFVPLNLKEIFPTFTGNVIDIVAISHGQSATEPPYLFVFSDNGNVYSSYPGTPYSQTIWQAWMFLPLAIGALKGVDAVVGGKSNIAYPNKGITFSFYFDKRRGKDGTITPGEIYVEGGCSPETVTWTTESGYSQSHTTQKCPNSSNEWTTEISDRISGVSNGKVIGASGGIYNVADGQLVGEWENAFYNTTQYIKQVYDNEHNESANAIRASAVSSGQVPFNNDNYDFHLMAADHEHSVPYYMTNENGISFLVTPGAKKITLDKVIKSQHGKYLVVHDFTKLTDMENDFLIMAADGYMYNPYFPVDSEGFQRVPFWALAGQSAVAGYSSIAPPLLQRSDTDRQNSWLSGVTHVNSYLQGYKVCFFFSNGDWYFVDFQLVDPNTKEISRRFIQVDPNYFYKSSPPYPAGASGNPAGQMSWLDWPHLKDIKSTIQSQNKVDKDGAPVTNAQYMVGIAYEDWTVYMWGTNNINGKMYSFNQTPPSSCDVGHNGQDNPPGCWNMNVATQTGLGSWQDIDGDSTWGEVDGQSAFIGTFDNDTISGWKGISKHNIADGQGTLIETVYWINFADASAKAASMANCNVFVFDKVLMKATYYEAAYRSVAVIDTDSEIFIRDSFVSAYENAFCVKHIPTGKYMYYDFIKSDTPKLSMGNTCMAVGTPPNDPTQLSQELAEAMGAIWGFSASLDPANPASKVCLHNLNPALAQTANLQSGYSSGPMAATCTEQWLLKGDGSFSNGSQCMYSDGTSIKFAAVGSSQCANQWSMQSLLDIDGGKFCQKPVCGITAQEACGKDLGSCDCSQAYPTSDPCNAKCATYNSCVQDCLGPTLAYQCFN